MGSSSDWRQMKISKKELKSLETTLCESYIKENLSDEGAVQKFFRNINLAPEKKDFYIKDFEEFYFKFRPKFGSKLIDILLFVSNIIIKII